MTERGQITREMIVAAARQLVETEGVEALSMRRLATVLDTKPMTLYHYVPSKAELLMLVLGQIAAEITWTPPTGSPEQRMVGIVVDMADRLAEVSWIVPILRGGSYIGPSALRLVEEFVTAAHEAGADDLQALSLWRSLWWLISSELSFRAAAAARPDGEIPWYDRLDPADLPEVPTVRSLLPEWGRYSAAYDLGAAVRAQVRGSIGEWRAGG
ncbi:TetR/AcrR family transcriptional regulator [Nakamurella silvestris]|nr:TetR/AcrR family transcriptional regulator [Nakamurella silvestris]